MDDANVKICSNKPGPVSYPAVMIVQGQALPSVHIIIYWLNATLPRINFVAQGQVCHHFITLNWSEILLIWRNLSWRMNFTSFWLFLLISGTFRSWNLFGTLRMSMRKTTLTSGQLLPSVHMKKNWARWVTHVNRNRSQTVHRGKVSLWVTSCPRLTWTGSKIPS